MPVPKQRTGQSDQGHRRSCWKATVPSLMTCPQCGDKKITHVVCQTCGYYAGRKVSERFGLSS